LAFFQKLSKVIKKTLRKAFGFYPMSFAMLKAAAAAITPTAVTLNAPQSGGCPVTLLLK
jgi:hypothetical protein